MAGPLRRRDLGCRVPPRPRGRRRRGPQGHRGEDGYSGFTVRDPVTGDAVVHRPRRPAAGGRASSGWSLVGLATDYCVKETALDAVRLGFETTVLRDGVARRRPEPGDGDAGAGRDGGGRRRRSCDVTLADVGAAARAAVHRPLRAHDGGQLPRQRASTDAATFDLFVRSLPDRPQLPRRLRARRRPRLPGGASPFGADAIDYLGVARAVPRRVPRPPARTCASPATCGRCPRARSCSRTSRSSRSPRR